MITVDRRLVNVKRIANECHLAISNEQEERNVKARNNAATKLEDAKRRYLKPGGSAQTRAPQAHILKTCSKPARYSAYTAPPVRTVSNTAHKSCFFSLSRREACPSYLR